MFDLLIGEFLCHAEQAVACVADDHVNASEPSERSPDKLADRRCVGHVEHFGVERFRITREQIGNLADIADGSGDAVATPEEPIGELAAEAAADTRDEPCGL